MASKTKTETDTVDGVEYRNEVVLQGIITKDTLLADTIKKITNNVAVIFLETREKGEDRDFTIRHDIVAFDNKVTKEAGKLKTGDKVIIRGSLINRQRKLKDGSMIRVPQVIVKEVSGIQKL